MADTIEARTFLLPVYKSDASGDLIAAGDTLKALLYSDDGIWKNQNLTVASVSADGRTIGWERDSGNLYVVSGQVAAVHADHVWHCAEAVNLRSLAYATGDDSINEFSVGSTSYDHTADPYIPTVAADAVRLEDDLNAALLGNGHATVTIASSKFSIWVMNSTYSVSVSNDGGTTDDALAAF